MTKDLAYYMSLPYEINIVQVETGEWYAKFPQLEGCMTYADTWEEFGEMIQEAKEAWFEIKLEFGLSIPEPEVKPEVAS